jgi:hypothetical protein
MRKKILLLTSILFLILNSYSVTPTKWMIDQKEDFLKGRLKGLSISSDGFLFLAPAQRKIKAPPEEFYLSLFLDNAGNIYLGTGHNGKIYKIDTFGNYKLIFDAPEMDVYCLTMDGKGNLYAGTSPNGRVYKITPDGKGSEFFNPEGRYIWDMIWHNNYLWIGVGEGGGIYKVNNQGKGEIFFRCPQNHILCLRINNKGEILAGTGSKGLVYKFTSTGTPSVLFESPYEEIRDLIVDKEGNIFVAAGGRTPKRIELPIKRSPVLQDTSITVKADVSSEIKVAPPGTLTQPGALYKIYSDGRSELIWSSLKNSLYSIAFFSQEKEIILATGNEGRIFSVKPNNKKVDLINQQECEQIYKIVNFNNKIYFITNNPSYLFSLLPEQGLEGEYLSEVMDAGAISKWGKIIWDAITPEGTSIQLFTRTGNSKDPGPGWSDWSPPYQKSQEKIFSLKARFIQIKAILKSSIKGKTPQLRSLVLFYQQMNMPPEITKIELLPPNKVYIKPPSTEQEIWGLEKSTIKKSSKVKISPKVLTRKGFQTIKWEAKDPNGDTLIYTLYIKSEEENKWRILKENYTDNIFTFETISLPDGKYRIKIKVSDFIDNPLGDELTTEKISDLFTIDNTPPEIKNLVVKRKGSKLEVSFTTKDNESYIQKVEYLIRPNRWKIIFPIDEICDSQEEQFKVTLPLTIRSDNMIVIKVIDAFKNIRVVRETF